MREGNFYIASRVNALESTAINRVSDELKQEVEGGAKVISLMRGEPDFPTPKHICDAAIDSIRAGRTGYPESRGELTLREAVSVNLNDRGVHYEPNEIIITSGATLGIAIALATLCQEEDNVLISNPAYDAYRGAAMITGAKINFFDSMLVNNQFTFDIESLKNNWTKQSKVLIINTPWNPTGTVLSRETVIKLMEIAEFNNFHVVSDEIYSSFTYDDAEHVSPSSVAKNNAILIDSFSKTYAMTGWRLGYCAGPREIIDAIYKMLQQYSRGPATFVQDAGVAALTYSQDCVEEMRMELSRRREMVCSGLDSVAGCKVVKPQAGLFVMVDCKQIHSSSRQLQQYLLKEHGVAVVHGAAYGDSTEGALRISFATGGDDLKLGIELLCKGLESAKKGIKIR